MEIEIQDELNSSDPIKQMSGLQKLNLNWVNQGRDPTLFFNSLIKCIGDSDNKTAKILSYNILKSCKAAQNEWSQAIPVLVKDLKSDDVEVVISILKSLPHISPLLTELLMVGNADFGHLVRHANQAVRRTALDTLMTLLFYRKAVLLQYKSFVSTGWDLIVEKLLDEQLPSVYQAAFNAVSTLFSEISRSVSHTDEFDNSPARRQALSVHGDNVAAKLVDHFDVLLTRSEHIEMSMRHVAVNTLAYLADTISRAAGVPLWPTTDAPRLSTKQKPLTSPQNIVNNLVDHFLSLLGSTNDALVFSVGKAVLDLLLTQANQHNDTWIQPVLTAFVGLLRREGVTLNPLPILLAIMGVLPMLNDDLLLATLVRIFPSIKSITDSNQRVSYLIRTFELLIDRYVTSTGKANLFGPLMTDQWMVSTLQDEGSSFREEIVVSMVASHHNVLSRSISQTDEQQSPPMGSSGSGISGSSSSSQMSKTTTLFYLHQVALNIAEVCLKCVLWPVERLYAQEYCIRFVDWLCRVTLHTTQESEHSQKLVSLLRSELLEQIVKIPSDYISLQSVFLIAQHLLKSPSNKVYEQSDSMLLANILRLRFLFLDNQARFTQFNGSVRDMVMGVPMYARAMQANLHPLSAFWLGALECLYLLGATVPSAETIVLRTLDDLVNTYPANKGLVSRAKFVKKALTVPQLRATPSFATANLDFAFCLPIEFIESAISLRSASDIFAYECKKAITGLAGVHYGSSIRDRPSKEAALVSGCGDPVWVEVIHTAHPTLHTISLQVTVTNNVRFPLKNITVALGLTGHLEFPHPLTQCKHQIAKLLPEKSYSFEVPLSVTGLDHNAVTFSVTYNHPSGMSEVESARGNKPAPVTMVPIETRCMDYILDWNQFLIPFKYNQHQFLQQWPRFEAAFQVDVVFEGENVTRELINSCLLHYPFHNVETSYYDEHNFQFAFSASTWFNDQLCFTVTGMDKPVPADYYHKKIIQARFEFRSSNAGVLASFQNVLDLWIHKLPRSCDQFLARLQCPGENSLFSITSVKDQSSSASSKSTPSKQSISEIDLLNKWKESKSNVQKQQQQLPPSTSLLQTIEQEFY
ncbi:hypothetical protein SAMD00019534_080020 [Acytostelium subglobosum LB1]|uniref:hypothetical protein n=1 Tax=Acytostelium subglobosum LB1 TaxID=1410327 RepID=UPI000644DEA1|nr:hypothetical protein SAMD00019534_080020 [Acytostelium subglobosum LB1]GAM24827.1 hypothetical protein SAMD00019534_080020 [Acytostelium subglobosum LB1]|eukprot:XP_012752496.1 hypothetical protein SAMD00019534_080020 [Acytostelium subglobosum LB1]